MSNLPAIQGQREMTPANWQLLTAIAETTARGNTEQAKVAKHLLFCFENELPLSLAVNGGLYTVKNRVEVEGTVIRAQIRKHPDYDYEIAVLSNKECVIIINRLKEVSKQELMKPAVYDFVQIGKVSFTIEDAKQAGLLGKRDSAWEKYPADMLLNRATSRAYKRFCPDIFMQSVYVRGEITNTEPIEEVPIDTDTGEILISHAELIALYGNELFLQAIGEVGDDLVALNSWLAENRGLSPLGAYEATHPMHEEEERQKQQYSEEERPNE